MTLPTVVTSSGLQPQTPTALRAQLIQGVTNTNPGYTADLPGLLIEDVSSTEVFGLAQMDSSRVDAVNSVTPYGVNAFVLAQLGAQFGIAIGEAANTSVLVVFTGTPGFVINPGFTVTDGTYQYIVIDGGVIGADSGAGTGVSDQLFAVASQSGSWAVPSGTVQGLVTSVPNTVTLTVNNPVAGVPSSEAQTEESYRASVVQAGLASVQGTPTMLKTQLSKVIGVQSRLVSFVQISGTSNFKVICGGGDPYKVAYAISYAMGPGISNLVGSSIVIANITQANPGVATTALNHGLTTGNVINIADANPSNYNVTGATVTVIDEKTFSYGVNTTSFPTYVGDGVLTPNGRNVTVSILDYPDTYEIIYVNPPQQTVGIVLTWNTDLPNFVSTAAVAQTGAPAIAAYINSITVGQPINLFQLQDAFTTAIATILDPSLISRMVFTVTINGVTTAVTSGTGLYFGDPELYFETDPAGANVSIVQG